MAAVSRRFRVALAAVMVVAAFAGGLATGHLGLAGAQGGSADPVFIALQAPVRYLDTRGAPFGPIGVATAAPVGPASTIDIAIAGASVSGTAFVPVSASSVLVNVTAVNATAESFVTAYATEAARPNASTMNPEPGRTTFNTATVAMGASGRMRLYNNAGSVNLVVDVVGYFIDHDHDDRYYTIPEVDARVPREQSVTLAGTSFVFDPTAMAGGYSQGCAYLNGEEAIATLSVPNGSTISGIAVFVGDFEAGQDYELELLRGSTGGGIVPIGTGDTEPEESDNVYDVVLAAPEVVDDDEYFVLVARQNGGVADIGLCSVTVHYTLPG